MARLTRLTALELHRSAERAPPAALLQLVALCGLRRLSLNGSGILGRTRGVSRHAALGQLLAQLGAYCPNLPALMLNIALASCAVPLH